jgi:hypothetical protein
MLLRSRREIAATRTHPERGLFDLDADTVPLAVAMARARIPKRILSAQFVRNPRGCRIEIARAPHHFGAAAAVVGEIAERGSVDSLVAERAASGIFRRRL